MSGRTVVVIGAGVAGTSAAWAATRAGASVHLIFSGAGASSHRRANRDLSPIRMNER